MVRSEGGSKGLSYKGGSVGEVRRAEEDPVVLWDRQEKVELGLEMRGMRMDVGLPEGQLGSRLKMMRCSSSTITDQL